LQAPAGVPDTCPFEIEWSPAVIVVQMGQGLDEMSIKKKLLDARACKCMHLLLEANNAEASPEGTELKARIQQARLELPAGAQLPPDVLLQLCELRWGTDRVTGWQLEWANRQEACRAAATSCEVQVLDSARKNRASEKYARVPGALFT
jgi:hypothetical protein